jgi:hypothetical protein
MSNATAVLKLSVPTGPRAHMNIVKTFRSATTEELQAGREWYRRARALAGSLVSNWGTSFIVSDDTHEEAVKRAAAVIAVLSPRLNWGKNVELASKVYRDFFQIRMNAVDNDHLRELVNNAVAAFPGLKGNGSKAYAIMLGVDPEDVVSGPKVTAFWRTIVDPSDPRAVVVDRHALDVAKGIVLDDRQRGVILGRKGAYEELSALYRRAAKLVSKDFYAGELSAWTPAEVQAVTWVVWRRNHAAQKFAAQKEEL